MTELAAAAQHRDALAAIALLNPRETPTMRDVFSASTDRSPDLGLTRDAESPFAGIDISVDGLRTRTTTLGDGVAKVTFTRGAATARFDGKELAPDLRGRFTSGTVDVADMRNKLEEDRRHVPVDRQADTAPFVVAVRTDGRWFVSPAYTAAEYLRLHWGLALPQVGSIGTERNGAKSATSAVRGLVNATVARSLRRTVSALAPGSAQAAADYLPALDQVVSDTDLLKEEFGSLSLSVSNLDMHEENMNGDLRKVVIDDAGGSVGFESSETDYDYDSEEDSMRQYEITEQHDVSWTVHGDCVGYDDSVTTTGDDFDNGFDDDSGQHSKSECLRHEGTGVPNVFVVASHTDHGWFVDPVATGLEYVRLAAENGSRHFLRKLVGLDD